MCEPFSLALATTAASLAATGIGMAQQQRAAKSQNNANQYWRDYQKRQKDAEDVRQEQLRHQAEGARAQTVDQMGQEEQLKAQGTEEGRLNEIYNQNSVQDQANPTETLLSGQETGGQLLKDDVASRLSQASADARKRIGALARINSYGGSFGGLQNRNNEIIGQGDQGINTANNMRQGSLSAFNIAKGVNPMQMPGSTDYASGIGSALAGIAGSAWGQTFRAPTTIGKV
jgi:hypothetical protein